MIPLLAAGSILDPIYRALGTVLAGFYSVIPSYGVAIALLTVAVRTVLIPLTAKQVKSQQAMQRLQPQIKKLQAQYKGDRQKLNEEMMKFYKEHSFNPLSGCLPVVLQAPLFIVLYRLINDLSTAPEKHLPLTSGLYQSLRASGGKMISWGIDLSQSAKGTQGLANAWPFYVMVALVMATGFYQQRQLSSRLPQGATNNQMQAVGKIFPVFIGLISLSIPAGVVVYFIVSNIWQIAQQAVTFRNQPPPPLSAGPAANEQGGKPPQRKALAKGQATGRSAVRRKPDKPDKPVRTITSGRVTQSPKASKNGKGARPAASPRPKGLPADGVGGRGAPSNKSRKDGK